MNATLSAQTIKMLPKLQTWEREAIEDKGRIGPFFSGFVSYAKDPINSAREQVQEHLDGWKLAILTNDEISRSASYQKTGKENIAWAEEFLKELG